MKRLLSLILYPAFMILVLVSGTLVSYASDTVRYPMHAGKYYPADKQKLKDTLKKLTGRVDRKTADLLPETAELKALIIPHGKISDSGLTSAHVSTVLTGEKFDTVILIGPDHYLAYGACSVSDFEFWETPLGRLKLNQDAKKLIQQSPEIFRVVPFSDRIEHSIELVLPFLQYYLKEFEIIPILAGRCSVEKTAQALLKFTDIAGRKKSLKTSKTLLVISSDLSRNLPYKEAVKRDKTTLDLIFNLDDNALSKRGNAACGISPLLLLIKIAKKLQWRPFLLHYSTSGEAGGKNKKKVTGYAAIAFLRESVMKKNNDIKTATLKFNDEQGRLLLRIARSTIAKKLGYTGDKVSIPDEAIFQSGRGTFVTLKMNEQLRGCIGTLASDTPLVEGIAKNAVNAAFNDYRFKPLSKDEFEKIEIEVSILTDPIPLDYEDADDLISKLRPGIDGVIIRKGNAGSTFLPQVWDQLPEPVSFLERLCQKAGLPKDAWQSNDFEVLTYQVQYFEE